MHSLISLLTLSLLPPAAHIHNERAMDLDEAGRLEEAVDELILAYDAMPDPRADLGDREQVLGSLRGVLLDQYARTGTPQPLCRLRDRLEAHVAALEVVLADTPERIELIGNRERLAAVQLQLTAFPANACDPPAAAPPAPLVIAAPPPPAPPTAPHRPAPAPDGPTAGQLRIAGGISLGIGAVLLGLMAGGIASEQRHAAASQKLADDLPGPMLGVPEYDSLVRHLDGARLHRRLAIGTGISSAVMSIFGITLFISSTRKVRKPNKPIKPPNGISLAPWWLPSGAGVSLHLPLR